jgi:tetratricopeptide (TPR) repeat protein
MVNAELMNLTKVCQSFPELEAPQIKRDNIINTIEDTMFKSGIKLVAVEGNEGIGRTTLLAQFAFAHSDTAISLFLRPESRWGYDLKMVEVDMVNQIHWIVNEEEIRRFEDVDDGLTRQLLFQLQRNARKNRRLYYFVVDGIDEVSKEDRQTREAILDLLPWNVPYFRFLLSCDLGRLPPRICQNVKCKPMTLTTVTFPETVHYFSDLKIPEESVRDIHRICRGMPSTMASVRRILESGTNLNDILADAPTEISTELFELEWHKVTTGSKDQLSLLSMLAYSERRLSIPDLSRILCYPSDKIRAFIQPLGFVYVMDGEREEIVWISEGFRKFAQNKLVATKGTVTDLIINDLQLVPESEASLTYLPDYLKQTGRLEDLLQYFSPNTLAKMIETTKSLRPLRRAAELGVESALKLQRHGELMSFSIYEAAVAELDPADIWQSEIKALMKLKKYDQALALAQTARLHEDRLTLLAIISRIRREQGLEVEDELLGQIRQLCGQIDAVTLGKNRIMGIASNLIFCVPDLAIELVEKAAMADSGENALDWAFAVLSIPALIASQSQTHASGAVETIRSKISASGASLFSTEYSLLLGKYSGDDVIREAENLENTSDRIYILRAWTTTNRRREDAISVVDYALKLAIKTTAYVPNATAFRELAAPLPFAKDHVRVKQLVGVFDAQREIIESVGPTVDYVRLQLLLARAELSHDFEAARIRLIDIYLYVIDFKKDLVVKAECIAHLLATLREVDSEKKLECKDQIHELVEQEMKSSIDNLLDVTADHYEATKGIIAALCKPRITDAMSVVTKLNTCARRDQACLRLVKSAIKAPVDKIDLDGLQGVISNFRDMESKDTAIVEIIERLFDEPDSTSMRVDLVLPIVAHIKDIASARSVCKVSCLAYALLSRCDSSKYASLLSQLLAGLDKAWESIDDGWLKVNVGFKIAGYLSECAPDEANKYLDLSVKHRQTMRLDNRNAASAYLMCLRLAIRAYGGLLPMNLAGKEDIGELAQHISMLPSSGERASLWAYLALVCYINGRNDDCHDIVTRYVKPLFESISTEDTEYCNRIMTEIAPALYCSHHSTALEQVKKLPQMYREMACWRICDFLLRKVPPSDPYDSQPGNGYKLTHEELVDVCDLVGLMERDESLFHFITDIADTVLRDKQRYSKSQKADITNRLMEIVNKALPDPLGISHDGYKIVSMAQISRIMQTNTKDWTELIDKARAIPNIADRAFSLGIIAEAMPPKESARRKELLDESARLVEQIPVAFERMSHFEELAQWAVNIDGVKSREFLRAAMRQAVDKSTPNVAAVQRRLIDFAYRVDPSVASSLASIVDDDPARENMATTLKNRVKMNDLKKKMLDPGVSDVQSLSSDALDYSKAAWMCLGALNSGRMGTVHINRVEELLRIASGLHLSDSYPILAWAIENMIQRNAKTSQAAFYLRPMYNATLLGAELSRAMAMRSSTKLNLVRTRTLAQAENSSAMIASGNREGAIKWLSEWIENKVKNHLYICDPFIEPSDLEIVRMVQTVRPNCNIHIITSKKNQDQERIKKPWDQTYREYWRLQISDQDPPDVDILIVGLKSSGELPLHDRWWLTDRDGVGIRLGTSFKSLGQSKDSEISVFSSEAAEKARDKLNEYLQHAKREHNGEKLEYYRFTL